jgi:hypothetical protein
MLFELLADLFSSFLVFNDNKGNPEKTVYKKYFFRRIVKNCIVYATDRCTLKNKTPAAYGPPGFFISGAGNGI